MERRDLIPGISGSLDCRYLVSAITSIQHGGLQSERRGTLSWLCTRCAALLPRRLRFELTVFEVLGIDETANEVLGVDEEKHFQTGSSMHCSLHRLVIGIDQSNRARRASGLRAVRLRDGCSLRRVLACGRTRHCFYARLLGAGSIHRMGKATGWMHLEKHWLLAA